MPPDLDRRIVLMGVAAGAATAVGGGAVSAQVQRPLRAGLIGAGWFGKLNAYALLQVAPSEIVALADVDADMAADARDRLGSHADAVVPPTAPPAVYADHRAMLAAHDLDIVIVGTPDHAHAVPAIDAMNAGAHVYLEKPVCVDIREGQALVAAQQATGKRVQVNTQRRTMAHFVDAKARVVEAGLLGDIAMVDVYSYMHQRPAAFPPNAEPPAGLDWDAYCGPAPLVPYNPGIHPQNWRAFTAFANGYMGDVGVHFIDAARWMLGLGWPRRAYSAGGILVDVDSAATVPDTQTATFDFDGLVMTWTNRQWGLAPEPERPWGMAINGDRGALKISTEGYVFTPADGGAPIAMEAAYDPDAFPTDRQLRSWERILHDMNRTHMRDFVAAIEREGTPAAPLEEGVISTACCVLANLSLDLGRPVTWDAEAMTVVDDPEAEAKLARPYRAPWVHPYAKG